MLVIDSPEGQTSILWTKLCGSSNVLCQLRFSPSLPVASSTHFDAVDMVAAKRFEDGERNAEEGDLYRAVCAR